ncbi:interleukin-17 receptor C [Gasterosteus aculeatus]
MSLALQRAPRAPLAPPPPPRFFLVLVLVLVSWLRASAGALEVMQRDAPELSCSEGLSDCRVNSASPLAAYSLDALDVTRVRLHVALRCSAAEGCEPYLRIGVAFQDVLGTNEASEQSGDRDPDHEDSFRSNPTAHGSGASVPPAQGAAVTVCVSSPGAPERWKTVRFRFISSHSGLNRASSAHQLLLTVKTTFGTPVVVGVYPLPTGMDIEKEITVPSLKDVCSMNLQGTEKNCDVPRIHAVIDRGSNVILLRMENAHGESQCRLVWNVTGEVLVWPKGKREMVLPSNFVAPCLCLQVWCEGKELRGEFCPFKNQQDRLERMQHNVSLSLFESRLRGGGRGLMWNVTAPCRLEAELRLCRKEVAGDRCEEVTGSARKLHGGWIASRTGHWKAGEFNVSSHPLLCVQIKLQGMTSYLEPHCPFTTSRWRWSLPIFVGLILMCLALLGAYLIQGVLKGYMWRWLKEDDVKGAVGGGHVVLLYPPDDDQALPELMSHLGSSLQALGFSVSLDLWSRTELGVLGPVPWLHSRLNRLQGQGGKVVLVLTQAAWIRAEEWGARSWERNAEDQGGGRSRAVPSRCVDVFTASFSCVLGDYLQGRAGERFMLVQFKSLPPEPPGGCRPLPELFRGLHVYSLPSQSLGFLTELAGARPTATASARRKRAGGLRMASRALARRLSGFTAGANVLRLPGVSRGFAGLEDSWETDPLQPRLITPPSSPDANHKVGDMEMV